MYFEIKTSDSYGITMMKHFGALQYALFAKSDACSAVIYITSDEELVRLFRLACTTARQSIIYEHTNDYAKRFIDKLFEMKGEYVGIAHNQLMKL